MTVKADQLTSAQWSALSLSGSISSVDMSKGTPIVTFAVTDSHGTPVTGLAQAASDGSYPNFGFAIAKLVPGDATTKSPSRWVNYGVVATPAAGKTAVPGFPDPEKDGKLKDNLDGTYTYTFALDITKAKAYADAATVYDAAHVAADLDDLSYVATLPHRLIITVGGNQAATGAVAKTSANLSYDFIPATGESVAATDPQRLIVAGAACNTCHSKLSMHADFFPAIQDTKLCVVCHTEQLKYASGDSLPATGTTLLANGYYGSTQKLMGRALANFPNMIHKIHSGENLYYQGYNQFGVLYNETTYPQDQRNCTKCHNGSATNPDGTTNAYVTPQGNNFLNVPSRLACGSCHDGINFATGQGTTLDGRSIGHVGGAQANDSLCTLCHDETTTPVYHIPVAPPSPHNPITGDGLETYTNAAWMTSNQDNLPAGASKMRYALGAVAVTNGIASAQFQIIKDGVPVALNVYSAAGKTEMIDNFVGTPAIELAFAVPQDNASAPVDFNMHFDIPLKGIWNGSGKGVNAGALSGPDANGYYTVKLTGVTIPAKATMVTVGVGYLYAPIASTPPLTQINLAAYPYNAVNKAGGLIVAAPVVWKVAMGYTPRRAIVDNARCNDCHYKLGIFTKEGFHAGQRNDGSNCNLCHNPVTGGNSGDAFWTADSRSIVHGIHAAGMRGAANPYYWHGGPTFDPSKVTYPGVLQNCEQCHLPNTYNFGNVYTKASDSATPTAATFDVNSVANMLYPVVASGTASSTAAAAPWYPSASLLPRDVNFGAAPASPTASLTTGRVVTDPTNLVNSPIAGACFACHADAIALAHMRSNGGSIYAPRATAVATVEQCTVCHQAGAIADTKVVHGVGQ
ncbi:MAG: OmcA/MtrC family decaheme c-type cytochrome [Burkholderiales bacterium]|nr:OmcA/MtrC family decaheme c-type cytochrome [Burkholderiales bacterium]